MTRPTEFYFTSAVLLSCLLHRGGWSAVLAVKQIPHGLTAGGVCAFVGFQRVRRFLRIGRFFITAIGAAVGETGLAGLEFELLSADDAGLDGIRHVLMIQGRAGWGAQSNEAHCVDDGTSNPYFLNVSATAAVLMNDKNCFAAGLFLDELRMTHACSIGG